MCRSKHLQKPKAFFSWIYCYNLQDAKWHSLPKKRWPMGGASHLSSRFCVHCKLGIITSCLHTIQDHPNSRSCIHPLHQHTFFQSLCSKKKHLNSTMSCFRFQKKTIQPPRGVVTFKGATFVDEHGLLSYRLLRWSNPTLCQSSGGCQAPGAFQGQGARLHGLRIPMSGWSEKLMGWWWGDGILGLPLTKTNSNVHTGIIHMIKIYIYITSMICIYIYF